ncbi:hypothetical protein IFR05_017028, partial [Cadophora sp. M221]
MKDLTTGLEYKMMGENGDPLWFEHNVLPVFYTCMLGLGLALPLVYLAISRTALFNISSYSASPSRPQPPSPPPRLRLNILLPILALTTALVGLCSFTEPYNLARPVYVCFYPVRGETFHHPEEARLRVQW